MIRSVGGVREIVRTLPWTYHDGGRDDAGFKGSAYGDCVCRAIAIGTGRPYVEVYGELADVGKTDRLTKRRSKKSHPRTGVYKPTIRRYLAACGWSWTPTMGIGTGCRVHLAEGELPSGRLIVSVSKHITAVIDGVVYDTHDPCRDGSRCVYGYWCEPTSEARALATTLNEAADELLK